MKIRAKDREIDLTQVLPLTIGDWADLEEAGVLVTDGQQQTVRLTAPHILAFVRILLKKVYGDEAEEIARSIPMSQMAGLSTFLSEQMEVDEPTVPTGSSTQPTPSEATDGPSRKSRSAASRT